MLKVKPHPDYPPEGGPESEDHLTGQALKDLFATGVDTEKRIIKTQSPHPFLFNISVELIGRFRKQISLIDLQFEGDPDIIRKVVWSCYQENPVKFRGYSLYDIGAYSEEPLSGKITWRVTMPWAQPADEKEEETLKKAKELLEKLRAKNQKLN